MTLRSTFATLLFCGATLVAPAASPTVSIFNGQDLSGWSGDPTRWTVKDGVITGQSTEENPIEVNTFLVWRAPVRNFELRAQFRLQGEKANSGIQYRSHYVDKATWSVGGYQADMDVINRYTGMLYEERGRGIVVRPGERIRIGPLLESSKPQLTPVGTPTDPDTLKDAIKTGDWNEIVIVAEGNHLRHYVNGVLTAEAFDNDPAHAASEGLLALQLHRGPPMIAQFKNLTLTTLP